MKTLSSFFTDAQWKQFNGNVRTAFRMQEKECSFPNAPDSTPAIKKVELFAKKVGLKTIWPGLYPAFIDSEENWYDFK